MTRTLGTAATQPLIQAAGSRTAQPIPAIPLSERGPHFSIDGVIGGVTAGGAGAAGDPFQEEDEPPAHEKVRKDFG